jgi:2-phospho-L-lactate guanylyltransferase
MNNTWVIIPVKPLRLAKSRLSSVVTPEQRQRFAETMLRHVLQVVQSVPEIKGTLVISRDNRALAISRDYGAKTVQESGSPELNTALMRATQIIQSWNSGAVLILPADLPLIEPHDITEIVRLGESPVSVVLATDGHQDGTNAMFIRPPGLIDYAYGVGSYRRHMDLAYEAGAQVHTYSSPRLQLDIDLPEDIDMFFRLTQRDLGATTTISHAFDLIQSEIASRISTR